VNKNELKVFDTLFKCLKDEKDWAAFLKLLKIYFDGILVREQFFILFHDKFGNKIRADIMEELDRLLQTRDQSRRMHSALLKPWNDLENQTFERVGESSYFKIDDNHPNPTATQKMMYSVYNDNVNDKYKSFSTGSENKNYRNTNEESMYKNEDKLFEFDMIIDNLQKCYDLALSEIDGFDNLDEESKAQYRFPYHRIAFLKHQWDKKFRVKIMEDYLKDNKVLEHKELVKMKDLFGERLEFYKT
jgi:histone deacetylase complex regulatory component SIN3